MRADFKNIISRDLYIDRVKPFIGKNLIKVFTGQRRVGKSYLLFQLIQLIKDENPDSTFIYINKEDLRFDFIRDANDLNDYILQEKAKSDKTYVFIDEIQDIKDFETALRSLHLNKDLDIYCTGSNVNLLSTDVAGKLSGRTIEITVHSLSYIEFLEFHKLPDDDNALDKYLKFGGLPYLKHLELEENIAFEYLKNIYSTIMFRDVINRYNVRNTVFLEQLVYFLCSNTGSLFSAKSISDFLKSQKVNIAPNQVQLYTKHLADAYLIHSVSRYDIEGKRLFEIGEKHYFENLGIRNALWGYRLEDRVKIIENVVYNHLLTENYEVNVGILKDGEIDFVAEKSGERIYIQAALELKSQKTIDREFGNLERIKDNYPKMVVTLDEFTGNTRNGIPVIHLRDFISNRWN